jgi:predicted SnoaL-like aldol condensation-catalyzing enzyme
MVQGLGDKIATISTKKEKEIALSFFSLIAPPEGPMAALRIFDPRCRHHNPYCAPGMKALLRSMAEVQQGSDPDMPSDPVFRVKNVVAERDMVAIHTTLQSKSNKTKGFRQVHLFRFRGEKVIEYWDVTQVVPKKTKYPKNMF